MMELLWRKRLWGGGVGIHVFCGEFLEVLGV